MQIFTFLGLFFTLLSPVLFWMYVLQSFPNLGIWRKQFFIGIGAGALSTLPLIYNNIWIIGWLVEDIFFSFSYISESFLGVEIFIRIFLFFALISLWIIAFIYYNKWHFSVICMKYIFWYTSIIAAFIFIIYIIYVILWTSSSGEIIRSWDYIFQGFALIFWYYIIVSLLEEGLKYLWNTQALLWESESFYKLLWYACVVWLGFSFFENILYVYSYYTASEWFDWIFQLTFFRSVFTVSLHILCAILLAAWLYTFAYAATSKKKILLGLCCLWGGAILSHAFFDVALSYGYLGVIFIYVFALYITVVYLTGNEWWAESG